MNPILPWFADGRVFFVGLATVAVCACVYAFANSRALRVAARLFVLLGVVLVLASATPLPYWAYAMWLLACAATLASVSVRRVAANTRLRRISVLTLVVVSIALIAFEIPKHMLPRISVPADTAVFVIGDSLSAGLDDETRRWPEVFAEASGLRVVNLAEAGATTKNALAQTDRITSGGGLVIVEIGGNDLLGTTSASEFKRDLEVLVRTTRARNEQIVIQMELPLLPLRNSYGMAQREVAAKNNITLVPKKVLTRALSTSGATVDGLHLSESGHKSLGLAMAEIVRTH